MDWWIRNIFFDLWIGGSEMHFYLWIGGSGMYFFTDKLVDPDLLTYGLVDPEYIFLFMVMVFNNL